MTKPEIKKLDKLASEKCKEDAGMCEICGGKDNLNAHHVIGRRNRNVRWWMPNLVTLCPLHHTFGIKSSHQDSLWFRKEMVATRGTKWEKELMERAHGTILKQTYEEVKEYLNNY